MSLTFIAVDTRVKHGSCKVFHTQGRDEIVTDPLKSDEAGSRG